MSEQEPWQRRMRRPDGSIDPGGQPLPRDSDKPVDRSGELSPEQRRRQSRDEWRAAASFGPVIGVMVVLVLVMLGLIGIWQARAAADSDRIPWLIVAGIGVVGAGAVGYLVSSISSIRYILNDESMTVRWRHNAHIIPYAAIDEVIYEPRQTAPGRGWELFWPGFYAYSRRMPSRMLRVVATLDARRRVAILTTAEAVELSPERPVLFLSELDRKRFGVSRDVERTVSHDQSAQRTRDSAVPHRMPSRRPAPGVDPRFRPHPPETVSRRPEPSSRPERRPVEPDLVAEQGLAVPVDAYGETPSDERMDMPLRPEHAKVGAIAWLRNQFREQLLGDQVASTFLAIGVIIPVLMAAFLYNQSAGLPDQIPLHWDARGAVDEVGEPRDLWRLPLLALVLLIGNTAGATLLIGVDRFLTRLLLAATPIVQMIAFIALMRLAS